MTRQTLFLKVGSTLLVVYLLLCLDLLPTPFISSSIMSQILPTLPFNLLVTLGAYCLWELGMGILTFGTCEPAYEELMKEISVARDDLRVKGVSVD